MSVLFSATYPDRVNALVLASTFAKWLQAPDYPCGQPLSLRETLARLVEDRWGKGDTTEYFAPGLSGHEGAVAKIAQWERMSGSPSAVLAILRFIEQIDVRPILPSVQAPTFVITRSGDRLAPSALGRYLAEHISGARYLEQEGDFHIPWLGDVDALLGEIEEFLTGARAASADDRVLVTVLFTDIVGSTEKTSELGDRRWRERLDQYDALVQRQLDHFRGKQIKMTGDGTLATFDGPARAIKCAAAIAEGAHGLELQVRSGIHTGEVELRGDDVTGIAVHIAARVQEGAQPDEVLVSSMVKDLVTGSGIEFVGRGEYQLKGVAGAWRLFAVDS